MTNSIIKFEYLLIFNLPMIMETRINIGSNAARTANDIYTIDDIRHLLDINRIYPPMIIPISSIAAAITPAYIPTNTIPADIKTREKETREDQEKAEASEETTTAIDVNTINIKLFTCEFCGKEFASALSREFHRKREHIDKLSDYYLCKYPNCNRIFRTVKLFKKHSKRHTHTHAETKKVNSIQCGVCKKFYVNKWTLKLHMDAMHPSESATRYKCPYCDYISSSADRITEHTRHIHSIRTLKRDILLNNVYQPASINLCDN